MSIQFNGTSSELLYTLPTALTIGTGDFSALMSFRGRRYRSVLLGYPGSNAESLRLGGMERRAGLCKHRVWGQRTSSATACTGTAGSRSGGHMSGHFHVGTV